MFYSFRRRLQGARRESKLTFSIISLCAGFDKPSAEKNPAVTYAPDLPLLFAGRRIDRGDGGPAETVGFEGADPLDRRPARRGNLVAQEGGR